MHLIDDNIVHWKHKLNAAVYRGNLGYGSVFNWIDVSYGYINGQRFSPRQYLLKLVERNETRHLNFSAHRMSLTDMLKFKYVLDIDGYASTFTGTFWKLYSGSVLLKSVGTWKQWYYDRLIPWVHFVPVNNNFSDLNEKIEWCITNDEKSREISENAKTFVKNELNWDTVHKWLIHELNSRIL
jgi:hypothetical protein